MRTKNSRWLCGLAAVVLGLFSFVTNVRADDPPWPPQVIVLALDPAAAEEGSDPATFLVVRIGPANAPLTVQYALGGETENGADYQPLSGSATIPQNAYFAPVTISPLDDFLVEGSESVVIALQQPPTWPPPYIVTWPSVAFAEIADNDRAPTNQPPNVAIVCPPDGAIFEEGDDIPIVARAFDRDGRVVTVEFFANDRSLGIVTNRPRLASIDRLAGTGDPAFELDADVLPDLDAAGGISSIPIRGDLFRLIWSNAPAGHYALTAVATDNDGASRRSASVEIQVLEAPPRPVVTIRATDPLAAEPNPLTDHLDTATFKIHRTGPTNFPLEVFYRIGGTASNGVDYRELPHSVKIPAGERSVEVIVAPIDDLLVEGTETVVISIVPPICIDVFPPPLDCYLVGRAHTARAAILDNDTPPNQPPVVRLVKPENGDVFIAPADIHLAALARDFDGYVTTVEFFEGTNSLGIVTNHPTVDPIIRPPFSLVWSNVPPGRYVLTAVATDNQGAATESKPVEIKVVPRIELPVVNIFAADPEAAETRPNSTTPPNTATFKVTRTGGTNSPLLVFYGIGGSASNSVDYRPLSGHVEIPAGARFANIVLEPIDDSLVEGTETVVLKLEPAPNLSPIEWYRIGSNDVARAFILDNDAPATNLPPRVAIVSPQDGDVFCAPVDIKLAALAHDPDGWVKTVEFFDGTNSLGIVTNSPLVVGDPSPEQLFRLLWENVLPGVHVLSAKATDNRGAIGWSDKIEIKVLPPVRPPVVTIFATDPYAREGNLLTPIPISADSDPTPIDLRPKTARFTVFRNGDTSEELTVFYKLDGTALNGADYRELSGKVLIPRGSNRADIVVEPIDDRLVEGTETVIAKLVPIFCPAIFPPPEDCYVVGDPNHATAYIFDNDFNLSPRAEIVHPSNGDIFRAFSDIEIDVVARDPDGWVSKTEFFANGVKIGEQTIYFIIPPPPGQIQKFSMVWSNVPPGEYALTARVTDDGGAMSLTDPVRIRVAPIQPMPVVTIEAIDPIASEPHPLLPAIDAAIFRVSRTGGIDRELTVHYRISATASNGVDYEKLSGVVTIPSNAPSALIRIVPMDDQLVEGTESVILALVQPPCVLSNAITPDCYFVGQPGRDVAYIRDNDLPNKPPTVTIVSPANGSVFTAPVDVRLVAAAGDPDGWVVAVEFFDGTNSLGVVHNPMVLLDASPTRLPEIGSGVLGENTWLRPFSLIWSNVPPGKHVLTAVATDNAGDSTRSRPIEIAVREPSDLPVVRILATDPIAREGTDNTATFRIRRPGPTNAPLTVFYVIRGTASNGVDYVTIPSSLTIPAGRRGARIVVTPINDNLPERIETVLLRLTQPPGDPPTTYEIGRPARAGAIILDNDCELLTREILNDGCIQLRLPVITGMPFRIESSSDLVNWEEASSGIAAEDGVSFVDDATGEQPQRFFRVVPEFGDLDGED
jgi:hypothetical protein